MWTYKYTDILMHHGVKGMKWGVRRFQNKDGTLTAAGKKKYNRDSDKFAKSSARLIKRSVEAEEAYKKYYGQNYPNTREGKKAAKTNASEFLFKDHSYMEAAAEYARLMNKLNKKYKSVSSELKKEAETGEAYIRSQLEDKLGRTYVSEIYVGRNDIKPVES